MQSYRLRVLMGAGVAALTAGWGWMAAPGRVDTLRLVGSAFFVAGGWVALGAVAWRAEGFRRKVRGLLRHLLAGNFEVGVGVSGWGPDEIAELETSLEKVLDHLRRYDTLRAERVASTVRLLDVLQENMSQAAAVLDVARETVGYNASLRSLLGISQRSVSLAALRRIEANAGLMDFIQRAAETEKSVQEGRVHLQLPAEDAHRDLQVRLIPVKGKDGKVSHVVIVATS